MMNPRVNKLKRLGAELYRLKRLNGGQGVPYSHNVENRMHEIREQINRLTREMLDRNEGVPPALVDDLMREDYRGHRLRRAMEMMNEEFARMNENESAAREGLSAIARVRWRVQNEEEFHGLEVGVTYGSARFRAEIVTGRGVWLRPLDLFTTQAEIGYVGADVAGWVSQGSVNASRAAL